MRHYREVSSAQILLVEDDTRHFVREVRSASIARLLDELRRKLQRMRKRGGRPRTGRSFLHGPSIAFVAFGLLVVGVVLCFVAALAPTEVPVAITTTSLPGPLAIARSVPLPPRQERIIDSEPHGALVFRGEDLIGTTPFVYATPEGNPLGTIRIRLHGYVAEERLVGPDSPAVVLVKLRSR